MKTKKPASRRVVSGIGAKKSRATGRNVGVGERPSRKKRKRVSSEARRHRKESVLPENSSPPSPKLRSIAPDGVQPQPHRPTRRSPKNSKWLAQPSPFRLLLVWLILIAGGLILLKNLFELQVLRSPQLQQMASQQQQNSDIPFIPRRPIVDRHNNTLAVDRPVYTLYAHPTLFSLSREEVAGQLASILKRPVSQLIQDLQSAPSGIRMADSLSESVMGEIIDLRIDGLELLKNAARHYPREEAAAEVVGYVNLDRQGQAGVELSQEEVLARSIEEVSHASLGSGLIDLSSRPILHLDDLRLKLTIDSRLQRLARIALEKQVEASGAKRGTVMVMDAWDGSLLCLVSTPSYDPNQYFNADLASLKNWAVTDLYEPGSTFKPINVAIALEAGAIEPNSTFYDPGQIIVDGWPIGNAGRGGFGTIDITQILSVSSNIGMVQIVDQMEASEYYDWLEKIGLGDLTHIDLPFESPSQTKSREQFLSSPVEAATTAFGQGFALTPIQMLSLQGALANGGKLVTPHVVQGLFDSKDKLHWQPDRPQPRQLFSPENTQAVLAMMEDVVLNGTGYNAHIPGYRVAGKTGTAQKSTAGGGYSEYALIASFVGILPLESPRYVVLAVVDEPNGGSGGEVAAPLVKSVMEILIGLEGIPPTQLGAEGGMSH